MKPSAISGQPSGKKRIMQVLLVGVLAITMMGASDTGRRFTSLGHELICVCGCNQILLECNHVGCTASERMRGELQGMLDQGKSDHDILQEFAVKYGNTILAAPTTTGFNLVAWIIPFLVLATATFFAGVLVRRWRSGQEPLPTPVLATAARARADGLDDYREQARRETEL
jgi:cytochrome c-type biogenesis protein CcmH